MCMHISYPLATLAVYPRKPPFPHPFSGRHYLSNATCLTKPHLLYVRFVVSRIAVPYFAI